MNRFLGRNVLILIYVLLAFFTQISVPASPRKPEFIKKRYLEHKVIPDLLSVVPKHHLQVSFYARNVNYGSVLTVEEIQEPPSEFLWPTEPGAYYCMAMVGLDVPIREHATESEFQHFLVVNIPGTAEQFYYADYPTMYIGANPVYSPGSHRIAFTVFKQPGKIKYMEDDIPNTYITSRRANFSTRRFAEEYKLGDPYAGNFFLLNLNDTIDIPEM